jgi:uncharacterized membrane protein YuzA (DUF378 family)
MKRIIVLLALLMVVFAVPAFAGPLDVVKGWLGGAGWTAIAFILTGLLAIGVIGKYTDWLANLFIVIGTFATNFGVAIKDRKITGDELKQTIADLKKIRDAALAVKTTGE